MNETRARKEADRNRKKQGSTTFAVGSEGFVENIETHEDWFERVFAAFPSSIIITDPKGNITECNQAAVKMHGCKSRNEVIGKSACAFIAEKDRQRALRDLKTALKQSAARDIEYMLVTKDGREFPAEASVVTLRDSFGNPTSLVAVVNDIARRKQAEEALSESEKKYRNVVDNIGIGVAIISPNMEILALNNQMRKWFPDIDPLKKPICYKSFKKPPRSAPCSYCPTTMTFEDGQIHESITDTPRDKETTSYRIVSTPLILDRDGQVTAAIEVVDDVTKRRRMEQILKRHSERLEKLVAKRTKKLRESEKHLCSVMDYASEAIVTIDRPGMITFWNKAAERMFGYSSREAIGKPITIAIPKWARKNHRRRIDHLASIGRSNLIGRTLHVTGFRKDGTEFPIELSFSTWKTEKAWYITCIVRDVTECREAERALKRLAIAVDSVVDGVAIADVNGVIQFVNPAWVRMHGYNDSELLGKHLNIFHTKDQMKHDVIPLNELALEKGFNQGEAGHVKKDGTVFPTLMTTALMKDENGNLNGFVRTAKDITERKKAELELQESEVKYRTLVEQVPLAIYTISSEDAKITSLNSVFEKITGWKRSEWIGKSFEKLIHPDDLPLAVETFQKAIRGENMPPYELRVLSRSGEYLVGEFTSCPQVEKGKVVGEFGIVRDITERKEAERRIQESEERFRSIVESSHDVIMLTQPDGIISYLSPACSTILGYDPADLVGKQLWIIHPDDLEKVKQLHFRALKGESGSNVEYRIRTKTGNTRWISHSWNPIVSNGQVKLIASSIRDITEKKLTEERLSALNSYGWKLNSASTHSETRELTMDAMERTLGFEHASFMITERNHLRIACSRGYSETLDFKLPLDGTEKGITIRAATTRQPVLVPDVKKDKDYVEGTPGMRSELAVPIVAEDTVLGVLNVESKETDAFTEKDAILLQILASHAATAISNLEKRKEIETQSSRLSILMKCSAEMIHSTDLSRRLQAIVDAVRQLGWQRVVLSVRDENLNIAHPEDIVTAGLTAKEREFLWTNRQPGGVWAERFGPNYQRFRIGEFYHLPWNDPWVREKFKAGTVSSKLSPEEMVDWNPDDLLYAPLGLADGRIVGVASMDDPIDGKRPTKETMLPLELFLHQAAVAIENGRLFQQLDQANTQIQEYAKGLELKIEEKTKELREAQSKLLKTERLAAIGELAGMIGHDLRNPLTGIAGATYYLRTRFASKMNQRSEEMLKLIEKNIECSNKIINDLLEYSRELRLELTLTTPRAIMKETLSQIKIPKKIKIRDATRNSPRIELDMEKMRRVFINIIKNAIDAMPKGGTLVITSKVSDDNVKFTFSDTGIGISKETLQRLWTPLFTTKAKGMGFGLAICKRIIEAHKGMITAESTVGEGSTFTVTVPMQLKTVGGEKIWVNITESLLSTTMKA